MRRKPTSLRVLQGNRGRRPLNPAEPKPPEGEPGMPGNLSKPARALWPGLVQLLRGMRVLTVADGVALGRLAECQAEIDRCQRAIDKHGITYESLAQNGTTLVRARPEVAMLADADRRIRGYLGDFGLTPAARPKVNAAPAAPSDPAEGYFGNQAK